MACFVVPMAEAIAVAIVKKAVEKKEKVSAARGVPQAALGPAFQSGISWSRKLGWLNRMLWGGVSLLALEHIWHGEIVPWPPFLTAMSNPAEIVPMLYEMAIAGTGMAVLVTAVWSVMVAIADKKARAVPPAAKHKA